jgi:hypothetical protein
LISCIAYPSSLDLYMMSSLLKGESMCQIGRTLTNQVVERRNMINIYLREKELALRVCVKLVELLLIGWLREET